MLIAAAAALERVLEYATANMKRKESIQALTLVIADLILSVLRP